MKTSKRLCIVMLYLAIALSLVSCGGGDGGGGGNTAPVANAGADQNVATGFLVALNGSGSSDADGDPLTYIWTMTSKPSGSTAALSGATTASPTFTPDVDGTYQVHLVVNDGRLDSAPDAVIITAATPTLVSITVTPVNPSVPLGLSKQFTATGTYADSSIRDITTSVTWDSTDTSVASISPAGLATSAGLGSTAISATDSATGISSTTSGGDALLTVTAAELVSIAVLPPAVTVQVTETQQFTAMGTYTDTGTADITGSMTWDSSNTGVATISASGVATGAGTGSTIISATEPGTGISSTASAQDAALTVEPQAPELSMTLNRVVTNGARTFVYFTIRNTGTLAIASGFFIDIWDDRPVPPSVGDTGRATRAVAPGMPAGVEISGSTSFVGSVLSGTAYGVIDSGNVVQENNESDNVSAGLEWDSVIGCDDVQETLGGECADAVDGFEVASTGPNLQFGGFTFDDDASDTGTSNICSLALYSDDGTVMRHAALYSKVNGGILQQHWAGVAGNCPTGYATDLIPGGHSINWNAYDTGNTCGDGDMDYGLTALTCEYGKLFISSDVPMALADPGHTVSAIAVSGLSLISDIQVHLDITHARDSDLQITLESPNGTSIRLGYGIGGAGTNYANTTFSDQATSEITAGTAPFTGTFRSEVPLSALIGEDPNGTWFLRVYDGAAGNSGTLNAWSLEILDGGVPQTVHTRPESDSGWYRNDGYHDPVQTNTLTGQATVSSTLNEYRSFFVFDLSGISGEVTGAVLKLVLEQYNSPHFAETAWIYDVVTAVSTLTAGGSGLTSIYNDLGSGNPYGSFTVQPSDVGSTVEIRLNANAVDDIQAALGVPFALGLRLTSISGGTPNEYIRFNQSFVNLDHELVLTVK